MTNVDEQECKEVLDAWEELKKIRNSGLYSIKVESGKDIADLHKILVEKTVCKIPNDENEMPYWSIPKKDSCNSYYEMEFDNGRQIVKCAPLYNFPIELRALAVDIASRIYSEKLLKFDLWSQIKYPNDKEAANRWKEMKERELTIQMASEFREDHILDIVLGEIEGNHVILGSMGLVHGIDERKIVDTIGCDGVEKSPKSSISTNFSLNFDLYPNVKESISNIKEMDVSEITRLFLYKKIPDDCGVDFVKITAALYAAFPTVVDKMYKISFFEFNTKKHLHDSIKSFGYPITIAGDNVRPTKGILKTIHKYYFINNASEIIPQFLDFQSTLELSDKLERFIMNVY